MAVRPLLSFDVETTTINKGNPFAKGNKLVAIGFYNKEITKTYYKEFNKEEIQHFVDNYTLITFNGKFDLAWLKNIDINLNKVQIVDVQLAEFLLTNQLHSYPDLDSCAIKYLNEQKIDTIKLNYWDNNIDTWFIPEKELIEYLIQDCKLTYNVFIIQQELLKKENKYKLFTLQCVDLLVLLDMQYNGIQYEKEKSITYGNALQTEINSTKERILLYTSCPSFNPTSGDHLNAILYGGTINHTVRIPIGVYKTGEKIGQPRYKKLIEEYKHEQLVEPIKGSELKKEGFYSVDEYTLLTLKAKHTTNKKAKQLIEDILHLSALEKLQGTYYLGIPKLMDEQLWEGNIIHGNFNQCRAITGRLSSSGPNLQNFDSNVKKLCISRYD